MPWIAHRARSLYPPSPREFLLGRRALLPACSSTTSSPFPVRSQVSRPRQNNVTASQLTLALSGLAAPWPGAGRYGTTGRRGGAGQGTAGTAGGQGISSMLAKGISSGRSIVALARSGPRAAETPTGRCSRRRWPLSVPPCASTVEALPRRASKKAAGGGQRTTGSDLWRKIRWRVTFKYRQRKIDKGCCKTLHFLWIFCLHSG